MEWVQGPACATLIPDRYKHSSQGMLFSPPYINSFDSSRRADSMWGLESRQAGPEAGVGQESCTTDYHHP